jgi:predicted XRE-type DNA-binding protein
MDSKAKITESSGNVFADLEVAEPEQALAKAELARQIAAIIRARRLSQRKAADVLGVDQPKVSALLHGRLSGFSADRLLRFLNALGQDVEIHIRPKAASKPTIQVVAGAGRG